MTSEPDADETSLIHLITVERANNDALELLADAMAETGQRLTVGRIDR